MKAVEYFLKGEFDEMDGVGDYKGSIHFKLTSQGINNMSVPLSIKEVSERAYYPSVEGLTTQLKAYTTKWASIPMFAKTCGQLAFPARLGKEVTISIYRLECQLTMLKAYPLTAKFDSATGNYNAHHMTYPQYDWEQFGNRFVTERLGLEHEEYATRISNYDNLSVVSDTMKRISTIIMNADHNL